MTLSVAVGARLREARGDRSAAEVAAAIDVTVQTYYRWEIGKIAVPHARFQRVAEVLGVPWEELFAPEEVPA